MKTDTEPTPNKSQETPNKPQYPTRCCRCGFCCLMENCPVSQSVFRIGKHDTPCPALEFDAEDRANCQLSGIVPDEIMGFDAGCCIKARAYANGICYDFSLLHWKNKVEIARLKRGTL